MYQLSVLLAKGAHTRALALVGFFPSPAAAAKVARFFDRHELFGSAGLVLVGPVGTSAPHRLFEWEGEWVELPPATVAGYNG